MLMCLDATSTGPRGGTPRTSNFSPAKIRRPQSVAAAQVRPAVTAARRGKSKAGRKPRFRTTVASTNQIKKSVERKSVIESRIVLRRAVTTVGEPMRKKRRHEQAAEIFDIFALQHTKHMPVAPPYL